MFVEILKLKCLKKIMKYTFIAIVFYTNLGHGNLLMDKTKDSSHDVPVKCEQTNKRVAELLKSMTLQISEMKQAYHICKEDLDKNKSVLVRRAVSESPKFNP